MSQSSTDTISGMYAAFARGDIATIVSTVAEDVDWRVPENLPHGGSFHGRDGVTRFFEGIGENWEGLELDLDALVSGNDRVLAVAKLRGRLRTTGEQTGYNSVHVWTMRDGVPVGFNEYVDAPVSLPVAHVVTA